MPVFLALFHLGHEWGGEGRGHRPGQAAPADPGLGSPFTDTRHRADSGLPTRSMKCDLTFRKIYTFTRLHPSTRNGGCRCPSCTRTTSCPYTPRPSPNLSPLLRSASLPRAAVQLPHPPAESPRLQAAPCDCPDRPVSPSGLLPSWPLNRLPGFRVSNTLSRYFLPPGLSPVLTRT